VLAALSAELDPAAPAPDFQLGRSVVAMLGEPEVLVAGPDGSSIKRTERVDAFVRGPESAAAQAHAELEALKAKGAWVPRDFSKAAQAKKAKK
jgi:hypothetical protein